MILVGSFFFFKIVVSYFWKDLMSRLTHQINNVNEHPIVPNFVFSHQVEIPMHDCHWHHVLWRIDWAKGIFPFSVCVSCNCCGGLFSGKYHLQLELRLAKISKIIFSRLFYYLIKRCIIKSQVERNVFLMPPGFNSSTIAHAAIRTPIGIINHIFSKKLAKEM